MSNTAIKHELWARGELDFKLHETQREIKKLLLKHKNIINTVLCSRRIGKTYLLLIMACQLCLKKKKAIVKYLCPELKQGVSIIEEVFGQILEDCPSALKPIWKENKKRYEFPSTGSIIQVGGSEKGQFEGIRGGSAHLAIIDEAGFCSRLKYFVYSVLRPTIMKTRGKLFLISTPSPSSVHEFIQIFVNKAKAQDNLITFTIHDDPMVTPEILAETIADYPGGEKNPEFRREFLCEIVDDHEAKVIHAFDEEKEKEIVREWERPAFYDAYTSGDIGFRDLTVYLFGYWDYLKATLVIEDELVMNGENMDTEILAEAIKKKESENFKDVNGYQIPVFLRTMDNDLKLQNDLQRLHKLNFMITQKDNKEAQINEVNMMIRNNQIIINPRCKHLIYHLKHAIWKVPTSRSSLTKYKEFARLPDTPDFQIKGGHADAVDALIYMVRNLIRQKNPYPESWGKVSGSSIFQSRLAQPEDDFTNTIKNILNIRK